MDAVQAFNLRLANNETYTFKPFEQPPQGSFPFALCDLDLEVRLMPRSVAAAAAQSPIVRVDTDQLARVFLAQAVDTVVAVNQVGCACVPLPSGALTSESPLAAWRAVHPAPCPDHFHLLRMYVHQAERGLCSESLPAPGWTNQARPHPPMCSRAARGGTPSPPLHAAGLRAEASPHPPFVPQSYVLAVEEAAPCHAGQPGGPVNLILRVTAANTLEEEQQERLLAGYHCYRGLLMPQTKLYFSALRPPHQGEVNAKANTQLHLPKDDSAANPTQTRRPMQPFGARSALPWLAEVVCLKVCPASLLTPLPRLRYFSK